MDDERDVYTLEPTPELLALVEEIRTERQRDGEKLTPALREALRSFEWYFDEKAYTPAIASEDWAYAATAEDADSIVDEIRRLCRLADVGFKDTGVVMGGALMAILDLVRENQELKDHITQIASTRFSGPT
jgi:hypothetical protein